MEDVSRDTYQDRLANFTTQIEHLILIFALLTDQSHIFLQYDKKGYGHFEQT